MFLWCLLLLFSSVIYFKLILPFFYWRNRDIFYVPPWTRLHKLFLNRKSFALLIREAYEEFPDKRYYGSYQFLKPSLFVRDLDLIKQITVKDFDHFTDHTGIITEKTDPILGQNLFSLNGQKWREMRSTLSPSFSSSKMKAMFALMSETGSNFADYLLQHNEETIVLEMKETFAKYTNDVIANCAFGIKLNSLVDEKNEFFQMGRDISSPSSRRLVRTLLNGFFPKIFEFFRIPALPQNISNFFMEIIKKTIDIRQKENVFRPDMIQLLMEARKGRLNHESDVKNDAGFATVEEAFVKSPNRVIEMTDEVITAQALVFFIAGFTTTSSLMSFLSFELATHPEIQEKLQAEIDGQTDFSYDSISKMKYLDQVVSEALRKWPPGYILNRVCTKNYVIKPKNPDEKPAVVEKDCVISIPVIGIHYDPDFFPDPENFDPERFSDENRKNIVPGSYMPFGSGPRNCIASRFALLEIKALMVTILHNFRIIPVEKTVIPMQLARTLALDVKGGVWLGLKRRK